MSMSHADNDDQTRIQLANDVISVKPMDTTPSPGSVRRPLPQSGKEQPKTELLTPTGFPRSVRMAFSAVDTGVRRPRMKTDKGQVTKPTVLPEARFSLTSMGDQFTYPIKPYERLRQRIETDCSQLKSKSSSRSSKQSSRRFKRDPSNATGRTDSQT